MPIYSDDMYRLALTREYVGPYVFTDGKLEYSSFAGGYFNEDGDAMYYVTDWQGNNVAVVNNNGLVTQRTTYYPYGKPTIEPTGQRYLFGGKEREHAGGRNSYDFGARCLIPYGRWGVPDNKSYKYYSYSPYAYCGGDPINYFDPDGEEIRSFSQDQKVVDMANNYKDKDNGNVIIFTHGASTHLVWNTMGDDNIKIKTGEQLIEAINREFETVNPQESRSNPFIIELHACRSGIEKSDVSSLAKKFSSELNNVIIKAPNGTLLVNSETSKEFVAETIISKKTNADGTINVKFSPPKDNEWNYYFRGYCIQSSDIPTCIQMVHLSKAKQILSETMKNGIYLTIPTITPPNNIE